MPDPPGLPVRRRSPDDPVGFSSLAVVPEPVRASPEAIARTAKVLAECWDRGVTTFDVAGARDPTVAAACVAAAFPEPRTGQVVIVPAAPRSPLADAAPPRSLGTAAPGPRGVLVRPPHGPSAEERLADFPKVLELGPAPQRSTRPDGLSAVIPALRAERNVVDVIVRCASREEVTAALAYPLRPLVAREISLLAPASRQVPELPDSRAGAWCVARDVFAGGRLDGTAWPRALGPSPSGGPPSAVRELEADFAPVLELAFLTRGGRRTLAQAAVLYVLTHPWVLVASIPVPSAERLDEILGYDRASGLEPAEVAAVESRGPPTPRRLAGE